MNRVAGRPAGDVRAELGLDWTDDLVWQITIVHEDDDPPLPPATKSRIRRTIRDVLVNGGDEHYPFVRFLARSDVTVDLRARPL
ncbi:hypothetical protein [Methylobacterium sp. J-076]|uniref:hypothetical protein n=1 Tax=Methylobacterium sp. J-076 TaxID=2836655 RepID=UPI001FB98E3C|nr:hypothetical protein [Methylobacterium sp. J-076]